jgi:hypothetical protein
MNSIQYLKRTLCRMHIASVLGPAGTHYIVGPKTLQQYYEEDLGWDPESLHVFTNKGGTLLVNEKPASLDQVLKDGDTVRVVYPKTVSIMGKD